MARYPKLRFSEDGYITQHTDKTDVKCGKYIKEYIPSPKGHDRSGCVWRVFLRLNPASYKETDIGTYRYKNEALTAAAKALGIG